VVRGSCRLRALWTLRTRNFGQQNSPGSQHCKPPNEWQIVTADNQLTGFAEAGAARAAPPGHRGGGQRRRLSQLEANVLSAASIPRAPPPEQGAERRFDQAENIKYGQV
jgi:hypothetical protein